MKVQSPRYLWRKDPGRSQSSGFFIDDDDDDDDDVDKLITCLLFCKFDLILKESKIVN